MIACQKLFASVCVCVLTTDLYKYSPDTVPRIHVVSYHVATDKPPPAKNGDKFRSIFSDNLQPIATRGKKARSTLLVDQHCGNGCSIKRAPLSVSYYNGISGGHIGQAVVPRRCSASPVLRLWCNEGGTGHNLYKKRLVILLAETSWLTLIANQKAGQCDLVYWVERSSCCYVCAGS